jgi:hypothetical protein
MLKTVKRRSKPLDFELIVCSVSVLLFQLPVLATQSIVLEWTPSSDTDVVGYRVYSGTASRNYGSPVAVGNTNRTTISGLADGVTYYFAATSIDSEGDESDFSNEAIIVAPSAAGGVSFSVSTGYVTRSAAATLAALPGSAGGVSFSVSGVASYQYVVQSSTNLINWVSVQTNTAPFTFTDTNAAKLRQCFYRTFYLPP